MNVDERVKDAGGRLADLSVSPPSFEHIVGRRQRQRRIALSTLTAGVIVIATAGTWLAVTRGDDAAVVDSSVDTTVAPDTTSVVQDVVTFDLALPGADLITDETTTARNAAGALWHDEPEATYLSLTVRPGLVASQPEPSGFGDVTEDLTFPADQGRAWFGPVALHQTMWWSRPDGAVWLLTGGFSSLEDTGAGTTMEQVRRWALGITATEAADGSQSFAIDDPAMLLADVDQAGDVRSRARVWSFEDHEITLLTIENSVATGVANQLARGRLLSTTVPAGEGWRVVVAADTGETIAGWALDTPVEAWVTFTIPAELADRADAIIDAVQPVDFVTPTEPAAIEPPSGWTDVEGGPLSPRAGAVGVWTGDEVLVIGGEPKATCPPMADCAMPDFAPLTDGAAFDPEAGTWRSIAPAPLAIPTNTSAVAAGGSVYLLVGPSDRPGVRGGFLRYAVAADSWTELPLPGDGWFRLASANDTVVAYSGSDENGEVSDLVLDPATDTWQELPPDPLSPSFDRMMVASGGRLYLFAKDLTPDTGSDEPALVRAARFDPATHQWELCSPSEIIGGWSGVSIGDEIIFPEAGSADGGEVNNWGRSYPSGGIYNTATDEWSPLPDPSMDDAFVVAGAVGDSAATFVDDHGHVLRLADRQWVDVPELADADETINRTIVAAGTALFVFGGESWTEASGETLADAHIWHPDR